MAGGWLGRLLADVLAAQHDEIVRIVRFFEAAPVLGARADGAR